MLDNPVALQEFRTIWKNVLQEGISIIALKLNSNPTADPVLVGVNMLTVMTAEKEKAFGKVEQVSL